MQRRDVLRWGVGIGSATAIGTATGMQPGSAAGESSRETGEHDDLDRGERGRGLFASTAESGRVAWAAALADDEPVVLGGESRCYVADASGLTAYDGANGDESWSIDHRRYPIAEHGDALFVRHVELAEFDAASGEERWRAPIPNRAYEFQFDDAYVYTIGLQGDVVVVDRETGRRAWEDQVDLNSFAFTLELDGDLLLVGTQTGVVAYDAATGDRLWEKTNAMFAVTVTNDAVFVGTNEDDPGPGVERVDRETGEREWRFAVETPYDNGYGTYGTYRFGEALIATYNGELFRVDPTTGELVWRAAVDPGFVGTHFVEGVVDGALVVQLQGELTAIDVESGDVRWANDLADVRGIHSAGFLDVEFGDENVFASDRDGVHAFDAATGDERWTLDLGEHTVDSTSGEIRIAHPIAGAGERVVASRDERLLALRANVAPTVEIHAPDGLEPDETATLSVTVADPESEHSTDSGPDGTASDETSNGTTDGTSSPDTTTGASSEAEPAVPDGVEVEWAVDGDAAGSGGMLDRAFARGEHSVTATATDDVGASTTAETTLLVGDPVTTTASTTSAATDPGSTAATDGSPGFGVLVGCASLLAAGYAVVRRTTDSDVRSANDSGRQ